MAVRRRGRFIAGGALVGLAGAAAALAFTGLGVSFRAPLPDGPEPYLEAARGYDAVIRRDTWGVPHVLGETDADAAFGLAYAHAEDDFETIQQALLAARGRLAELEGRSAAEIDYVTALLRVREHVDAQYEEALAPRTRALVEGYADGLNLYAAEHPEEVHPGLLPATGKDVVAGFVQKTPFFYGLDETLRAVFEGSVGETEAAEEAPAGPSEGNATARAGGADASRLALFPRGFATRGSNAFAVAPSRSAEGRAHLAVNSHQPWEGPVAWYEAHVKSREGWNTVGGVFPGSPVVLHGHNPELGWAFTVNQPDLVDVYRLKLHPEDPGRYRYDGEWRELERDRIQIRVHLFGPFTWTAERERLRSVHGPVLRTEHGTYAIRYAGAGEVRAVEQWYRMNRAESFAAWRDAMRMRAIPSFNVVYADRAGNVHYLYNALLPLRAEGYGGGGVLPGDTSEAVWTELLPFERLPQVTNPPSGFVLNCNSTPFRATAGPGNPDPADYPERLGIDRRRTNRARRARERLAADESISREEFRSLKYDVAYSERSEAAERVRTLLAKRPFEEPRLARAAEILAGWDLRTNEGSRAAAIGVLTLRKVLLAERKGEPVPELVESFREAARHLEEHFGRLDPRWEEVLRLRRGELDLGISGGPDVLHAVYGELAEDGRLVGHTGDSYVLLAHFDEEGVASESLHQYGSATGRPESEHYADQAKLFAKRGRTKPVWMTEKAIRANLARAYRPGPGPGAKPGPAEARDPDRAEPAR